MSEKECGDGGDDELYAGSASNTIVASEISKIITETRLVEIRCESIRRIC